MSIRSKLCRGLVVAAGVAAVAASAQGQSFSPIAFGPLGNLPSNQYFVSVADISGDGRTFVGATNLGVALLRTPTQDYTLTGTGLPFSLSRDGRTVGGGSQGIAPRRWDIGNAVGNTIASTPITPPPDGGFVASPAYNVNSDGTRFAFPTPTSVLFDSTYRTANAAFQAVDPSGFAGAYRGMASDAPIISVLGNMLTNPTNAYIWNYETNVLTPFEMPAGANSISPGAVGAAISADGSRIGGTAQLSLSMPYWWEHGSPRAVSLLPGSIAGSILAMNYTGTLAGGQMTFSGGVGNRAFLTELDTGIVYNLHDMYSAAGLLPAGWTLLRTQHISDDGSRVFCQALAPDGSLRMVELGGNFVPAPGPVVLLAVGGLVALRRRRN